MNSNTGSNVYILDMQVTSLKFEVEGFDGGIESRRAGNLIEILYSGMPVIGFDAQDLTARDWTIAALLEVGLKNIKVAALCHTSPAQVSMVKKLVRSGGHEALIHQRPGRTRKLTGARLIRAIALRRSGATHQQIGKKLGVSSATARRAVLGIPRGKAEQQEALPGVGAPPEREAAWALHEISEPESSPVSDPELPAQDESTGSAESSPVSGPVPSAQDTSTGSAEEPGLGVELPVYEGKEIEEAAGDAMPPEQHDKGEKKPKELIPAMPLPPGPAEHPCRYAGTLLICAAMQVLGLFRALKVASVQRPETSWYDATQAVTALLSAWAAGFGSLEAMHERDARALGVVLGLERSPCVRTLHRAIAQMVAVFDPIALAAAMLRGLMVALGQVPRIFGVDGHFKPYFGTEPVDKGWDTKRRLAHRGLADVVVHDEQGRIWLGWEVGAGDSLHEHVLSAAKQLRGELGLEASVVMGFDRGGFSFEVLERLDRASFGYVAWVPASVSLPELSSIAPVHDGIGEQLWEHSKLSSEHRARLLVQRDGETLVPAVTNLPADVGADEVLKMLRSVRGWQENDIKATRAFAHIDRLVDRGDAHHGPDDRPVDNPKYKELSTKRQEVRERSEELDRHQPISRRDQEVWGGKRMMAEFEQELLKHQLSGLSSKVPRCELEPEAQRAWLKTRNRSLLQPLKYALANARRWLLGALGAALCPSDAPWDATAMGRTLEALIRAPGTVRFAREQVVVTLDLLLPPKPHARLAQGLEALDAHGLHFSDGCRSVVFRLAPRPTHDSLPSATPVVRGGQENSEL